MSTESDRTGTLRIEVQALRAAAVLAVIGYHFWPGRLPGGFLGVDIFFVISGFLITAHLVSELDTRGRISFSAFYARRARRILPAALVVLAACLIATFAFASVLDWTTDIGQIAASALFVQNWYLALSSVDYLGSTAEATLVQHYWSLSVEEQFYLVWPALVALLYLLASRRSRRHSRRTLLIGLAVISTASLAYAFWAGATNPDPTFFDTGARAWQFAAGGMLAVIGTDRAMTGRARLALGMLGWVLIAASLVMAGGSEEFVVALALAPVLGTLLVIGAGVTGAPRWWVRVQSLAPIRVIAEISFSAYLWHWPVLVVAEQLVGRPLPAALKVGLVALTLGLAWATTIAVENPARFGSVARRATPHAVLVSGAITIALVVLPSVATLVAVDRVIAITTASSAPAADNGARGALCVGAEALDAGSDCIDGPYAALTPNPLADRGSISALHERGCATTVNTAGFASCVFGDPSSDIAVALIGDSTAMKMYPAIERLAIENGWRMVTYLKGACPFRDGVSSDVTCTEFRQRLASELAVEGRWDLVVSLAASNRNGIDDSRIEEFRTAWRPLIDRGVTIAVIRSNPRFEDDPRRCVIDNLDDPQVCDADRDQVLLPDVQVAAARGMAGVHVIDLTDQYCTEAVCPVAIGGILVYRDKGHINDEYAVTLAPAIGDRLRRFASELFANE